MDTSLDIEIRQDTGKGAARKLRASGKVPAVIYKDGQEARHGSVDPKLLLDIFRKTQNRNTVLQLQVDGATVPVIVKDAQRHPVSREILHVDFYEVQAGKPVEVMIPVRADGRPVGAALGGRIQIIRRDLRTRCAYDRIPEAHVVDVSPLDIGDIVKASQIPTGEGVEVVYEQDFNVLTCAGKRGGGKR